MIVADHLYWKLCFFICAYKIAVHFSDYAAMYLHTSEVTLLYFRISFVLLPLNILSNNFVDKNVEEENLCEY